MPATGTTGALLPLPGLDVELPLLEPPPQPAVSAAASARTAPSLSRFIEASVRALGTSTWRVNVWPVWRAHVVSAAAGAGELVRTEVDRHERALVRDAQRGSAAAFEQLFRSHWPRAYRAALL